MRKEDRDYKCTLRITAQGCGCEYKQLNIIYKHSHHQIFDTHELHQSNIYLRPTYNGKCKSISSKIISGQGGTSILQLRIEI